MTNTSGWIIYNSVITIYIAIHDIKQTMVNDYIKILRQLVGFVLLLRILLILVLKFLQITILHTMMGK